MERRREARRLATMRGQLEADRLQRLSKLTSYVKAWRELDSEAQETATQELKGLVQESIPVPVSSSTSENIDLNEIFKDFQSSRNAGLDDKGACEYQEADLSEVLTIYPNTIARTPPEPSSESMLDTPNVVPAAVPKTKSITKTASDTAQTSLEQLSPEDTQPKRIDELPREGTTPIETPSLSTEIVKSALSSAYLEYRASLSQLHLLSRAAAAEQPAALQEEGPEMNTDYTMSKTQHQLTVDEGKFWEELVDSAPAIDVEDDIVSLAEKSSILCVSYERRTQPPTTETYEESIEILHSMGIPCVECEGPFEAEALASSLVLRGLADFVASEDTDVIVYGAPLIRNLTRQDKPLVVVSEVCTTLELDQKRFVDFALLLGTDFSQRIKNVGPKRALKFIREHGTIEKILEHETRFPPRVSPAVYLEQVAEARLTFETLPPTPDAQRLQPLQYDEGHVHKVLHQYGLGREIPETADWDYNNALAGNYFQDNPSVP